MTLLFAAAVCSAADAVAASSPAPVFLLPDLTIDSGAAHYPGTDATAHNILNPFAPATAAVQLADHDHDDDRGGEREKSHQGRGGEPSDKRWDNAERRHRIEDRRRRFEALPQHRQQRIMRTRERFLHLPPEDRERLRQRWQQMSPEDRRRWRESESHHD
ncbi:MAG: DUF3106 domain-containing protein [Porticoccaceae bacterium]